MNELAVIEQNAIVAAFQKQGGTAELFERIAEQARSFVPDVTTKKGRDAIGSLAMKVSKSKTLTEQYAKDLVAAKKAEVKAVDDDRIAFSKNMDALRSEILAPRDAWEQAETDRVQGIQDRISQFSGRINLLSNSDSIKQAIVEIEAIAIDESFQEFANDAAIAKDAALTSYRQSLESELQREAEQAELARLRAEALERERIEHDRQIAEAAANKARAEAEAKAQAERQAAEKARIEAENKAEAARVNAEREQARLIAEAEALKLREEKAQRDAIEAAKQAELDKQAAIEAERVRIEREAVAKRLAEKQAEAARQASKEHVRKINQEALAALVSIVTEEQAKEIIKLIAKGSVPHISIKY